MKAAICTKYGSPTVLQLQEVDRPIPKDNEILVKIYASSVTAADGMMRKGAPYIGRLFIGLTKPKIPVTGTGFAGVIESIGKDVVLFEVGDKIFGESIFGHGTNAEYTCVPEDGIIATMPHNMSYIEAAVVCDGALTSMNFLKDVVKIEEGQKILINGASGSLGTAAVQLAKYYGAEVTGVCSTGNIEMIKSLGADHVIDYKKDDFTKNLDCYDIIYDTVGKSSYSKCKGALKEKGAFISPVLNFKLLLQMMWTSKIGNKKAKFSATGIRPMSELRALLNQTKEIIELGKLKSIIDKQYSLEKIADAHSYVDKGHKKGNVVISIDNN